MADDGLAERGLHRRKRRVSKHANRKRRKLIQNIRWVVGGFLIGLPLVVLLVYVASALAAHF